MWSNSTLVFSFLVFICSFSFKAHSFPMVMTDPAATKVFDQKMFDFVSQTLASAKLMPQMKCNLTTRIFREVRKFSDGERWVEILDVEFHPRGFFADEKVSLKIPMTAKYGLEQRSNSWSGVGEIVKIETGDAYGHWLLFTHDGKNGLVQLEVGNRVRTMPCSVQDL